MAAPVKYLKKALGLVSDDILHVWGKKYFKASKAIPVSENADSVFLMLRVKALKVEAALRVTLPGLFTSPRLESGEPDWAYKIV